MLNKLEKGLTHAENAVNGFLILAGVLVLFVNIIARAVFHNASSWAEEAIRYSIIWVTFFGGSQCAKAGNHVGIDLVIQVLPQNIQHIFMRSRSLSQRSFVDSAPGPAGKQRSLSSRPPRKASQC